MDTHITIFDANRTFDDCIEQMCTKFDSLDNDYHILESNGFMNTGISVVGGYNTIVSPYEKFPVNSEAAELNREKYDNNRSVYDNKILLSLIHI